MFGWLGSLGSGFSGLFSTGAAGAGAAAASPLMAGGMDAAPALSAMPQMAGMPGVTAMPQVAPAPVDAMNGQITSALSQAGLQTGYDPATQMQGVSAGMGGTPSIWDRFTQASAGTGFVPAMNALASMAGRQAQGQQQGPPPMASMPIYQPQMTSAQQLLVQPSQTMMQRMDAIRQRRAQTPRLGDVV